jgi:hypothetical protein
MFVILNPSHVILSEAKNLDFRLRTGSLKSLRESIGWMIEISSLPAGRQGQMLQNDIVTHPLE